MSGIEKILSIIQQQAKQTEEQLISSAKKRAEYIEFQGDEKAKAAYEEHLASSKEKLEQSYVNSCKSVDADIKRKLLACKVACVDEAVKLALDKLRNLPDKEYFDMIASLAGKAMREGNGVISFGERDLARVPDDLAERLNSLAAAKNGTVTISSEPADIHDGFILSYGLISENYSFDAVIEAEKERVRDTAAKAIFG